MPYLTIILPSYNHAVFLHQRLDSVLNQTFKDFEIIVIDDCSTDNSLEILEDFRKKHPDLVKHFIVNEKNSGSGYRSWEKGIELAVTEYIWIAETDDFSAPGFLQEMIDILDACPEAALAFCGNDVVNENGSIISNSDKRTSKLQVAEGMYDVFEQETFLRNMPFSTFITNGSSVVFRKPESGFPGHFFNYKQMTDAFLWTYLISSKKFAFLNKKLNSFRRHSSATTVRMYKHHVRQIFFEKADYLNYFGLNQKFKIFVKEYLRLYVWHHKSKIFDFEVINRIQGIPFKKMIYLRLLLVFFVKKSFSKIFKSS